MSDHATTEDHLEAAKFAKMLSGELGQLDAKGVNRSTGPANKININSFIHKVTSAARGEQNAANPNYNPENPDNLASSISEDLIRQLVPDSPNGEHTQEPYTSETNYHQKVDVAGRPAKQNKNIASYALNNDQITKKDFLKLVKSVDKIGKVLETLVEVIKNEDGESHTTTTP